jgi:hypothetical protein
MSSQLESIYSDELILLAETLGEVKTRTEKLEGEFSTHAKPLEAATNALSAALSGIKALQFHVLDNNLGALSARVEEMRKAVDEQVGVIALELKKADETNAAKAGADAEALRSEIVALQSQLGSLVTQFGQQLERVEFAAKEEAKKLQLIPGPAGAAGASLNPRGTFIDGEVYNRLDVVSWLGSSYIATVDGVTEKPSKNSNQWQTLASRGGGGAGGVGDFGSLAGVAQINQGGTGQTTRALALNALLPDQAGSTQYMLLTDGSGTVSWGAQPVAGLPSQTSNSGRLLTTNGSTASWSNAVTVSGSNATVTGTLTVNGGGVFTRANTGALAIKSGDAGSYTDISLGRTAAEHFLAIAGSANNYVAGTVAGDCALNASSATAAIFVGVYGNAIGKFTSSGLSIPTTTASTSTSSGALVVGNGTSGGLGVGGAINAGGILKTTVADAAYNARFFGATGGMRVRGYTDATYGTVVDSLNTAESVYQPLTIASSTLRLNDLTNGAIVTGTGTFTISGTTASTSTSSGALVVSGGVGVAGAITAGGTLRVIGSSQIIRVRHDASNIEFTNTAQDAYVTGTVIGNTLQLHGNNGTGLTIGTTGIVSIANTTASTSTSSGALVVSGGVGVAGSIYAGNVINATVNGSASIIGRNGNASSFTSIAAYSGASDEVKGALTSSTAGVIILGSQTNHPLAVYVNNAEVARWDTSANFQTRVTGTAPSLTTNSTMTFELTSNTSLKIFVRGSDGTTRSTTLTLA